MSRRVETGPLSSDPIEAAIAEGKIPPSRRDHYREAMAKDKEGTTKLLASLAPVLGSPEMRQEVAPAPEPDDYPREWLGPRVSCQPGRVVISE